MTKDEFYEQVTTLEELIDFCCLHGFEQIIDGWRHVEDFDDWVWNTLEDERSSHYWYEAKRWLNELEDPTGEYFKETGLLEYVDIFEEDLHQYMDNVYVAGLEIDFWEDEECYEYDDDERSEPGDEPWDVNMDIDQLLSI